VAAGWSEEQVAQAVFFTAYFNMLTRIAAPLALPPDSGHRFDENTPIPMLPRAGD